jgi:hypothetical protein
VVDETLIGQDVDGATAGLVKFAPEQAEETDVLDVPPCDSVPITPEVETTLTKGWNVLSYQLLTVTLTLLSRDELGTVIQ